MNGVFDTGRGALARLAFGIASLAFASEQQGGFEGACEGDWGDSDADERLYEEIRITVLHEIGHHFGLDEDDLDELGYA